MTPRVTSVTSTSKDGFTAWKNLQKFPISGRFPRNNLCRWLCTAALMRSTLIRCLNTARFSYWQFARNVDCDIWLTLVGDVLNLGSRVVHSMYPQSDRNNLPSMPCDAIRRLPIPLTYCILLRYCHLLPRRKLLPARCGYSCNNYHN